MMWLLIAAFAISAAVASSTGQRLGRWTLAVAAAPLTLTSAWVLALGDRVTHDPPAARWNWVEALDVGLSFSVDGFGALFTLIVCGIGLLVLAYSAAYFADTPTDEVSRFAGLFALFAGAMVGVVLADDLWTLLIFWEITSITSYLLIGMNDRSPTARASALRALLVTGSGGLAMLGGIVAVSTVAGTTSLPELAVSGAHGPLFETGLILILIGAFTKSAQVPFHFWLPGAMEAPTPVSAFLHSATMVKAGVVVVARLAPMFAGFDWWRPTLVAVGVTTMVLGAARAMRANDAKLLLAFGTVSQLGFLMVLFGVGMPEVTAAAVAMLVAHAMFKAALFMAVGIVDHATGTRDIRALSGLGRELPWFAAFTAVVAASMAGLPPMLGFVAKEAAITALLHEHGAWAAAALVGVAVGSVLTVAYTWRFVFGVFGDRCELEPATVHHRPSPSFVAPLGVLAVATVVTGVAAGPVGRRLGDVARSLDPASHGHLALWPGLHLPLGISALIVAVGVIVALAFPNGIAGPKLSAHVGYHRTLDALMATARRTAAVAQNGSLPSYLTVVFSVVVAVAAATVAAGASIGDAEMKVADSPIQVLIVAVVSAVALSIAFARRRFVAVVLLGISGYGLAVLFLLYGAPDLALTQVLVESLMIVVFMLVLRRLPEDYTPPPSWAPKAWRIGIATAVGVGVAALALFAGSVRDGERPVTDEMAERAVPEAGGRNLVNVIIVDFRGFDTMGEITVLGIAAIGVTNLVRAARKEEGEDVDQLDADPPAVGARSVVFDTIARMAFHITLVISIYVTFRGHNAPGGGFAGGLIAGAAFLMRFLAAGQPRLRRTTRLNPAILIGAGIAISAFTAAAGLFDGELLQSSIGHLDLPLIGELKLVSSTVFDVGVYVLVIGAVLSVIANLGADTSASDRETVTANPTRPIR